MMASLISEEREHSALKLPNISLSLTASFQLITLLYKSGPLMGSPTQVGMY